MDLHTTASLYPSIAVKDILDLPFPVLPKDVVCEVVDFVRKGWECLRETNALLTQAVRAVEIAIEEGEEAALAYLEDGKTFVETRVLPKLFQERHYISTEGVRQALKEAGLSFEPETVRSYLHEWTREGRIHDAGRGWYSDLPKRVEFPVTAPMTRLLDWWRGTFPLETSRVWSTEQIAPHREQVPARHLLFLYVERDSLELVGRQLAADLSLRVAIHPLAREAERFHPADWDVVLRPLLKIDADAAPSPLTPEAVLVDLAVEAESLNLLSEDEYRFVFEGVSSKFRLEISQLLTRCKSRNSNIFDCEKTFS